MSAESMAKDAKPRINQVYRGYLTALFDLEYYRERHGVTLRYARHIDFIIALGAALTGGSGLAILADDRFAWACGVISAFSVVLAVAKNTYNWSDKIKWSTDLIGAYSKLSSGFSDLVEDLDYKKEWNEEFEERFKKLRGEKAKIRPYPYPHLNDKSLREIQNKIKARVQYKQWWNYEP